MHDWLDYGRAVDPWLHQVTGSRHGRLAPVAERLARLPAPSDPRTVETIEQWGLDASGATRLVTPLTTATDGRRKLQRRGGIEDLVDLAEDPGEIADVESRMRMLDYM